MDKLRLAVNTAKQEVSEKYPEHEKMALVAEESQLIGAFVEWLGEQGVELMVFREDKNDWAWWLGGNIEAQLAEYFGIDLKKISAEKDQMLAEIREMNANREVRE